MAGSSKSKSERKRKKKSKKNSKKEKELNYDEKDTLKMEIQSILDGKEIDEIEERRPTMEIADTDDDTQWWEKVNKINVVPDMNFKDEYVNEMWNRAEELWVEGETRSQGNGISSSDQNFLKDVMRAGTMSDKVAALTLAVQQNVLYSLTTLQKLTTMASKQGQRSALLAIEALRDLYVENVLPSHRRLIEFQNQPLDRKGVSDMHLIVWYFEAEVKRLFGELVNTLEQTSFNNVEHFKMVAIKATQAILSEKPEGEARLLSILVNKLGDPQRKVAAKTMHLLQELSSKHPNMQLVIVKEIQQFMCRPNVSEAAQYYSILFLNQIFFRKGQDTELAEHVVMFYFEIFKRFIQEAFDPNQDKKKRKRMFQENDEKKLSKKKRKELEKRQQEEKIATQNRTRHLSAILTGINRAFPYASTQLMVDPISKKKFLENVDSLFKLTHVAPLHTATQALAFLFQIVQLEMENKSENVKKLQNRFYRALYERMMSKELWNSQSRLKIVLNLMFRAMKHDPNPKRVRAFTKRLLQSGMHGSSALSCGTLYLISALSGKKNLFDAAQEEGEYDPSKRDPIYSNADQTAVWELVMSQNHYHPSVRAFCNQMHENGRIKYNGDPLVDFSLKSFLNRFSYRNPKSNRESEEDATRQHKSNQSAENISNKAPVNSNAFLQQPVGRVRPDEMFFYRFFSEKARRDALRPKKLSSTSGVDVHMSEQDEEEAFAQRLAESLMKDEAEDDPEIEFSMSESESDEEDEDEDVEYAGDETRRKKRQLYVAAEEFSEVLEKAGGDEDSEKSKKQLEWENGKRKKRRKR